MMRCDESVPLPVISRSPQPARSSASAPPRGVTSAGLGQPPEQARQWFDSLDALALPGAQLDYSAAMIAACAESLAQAAAQLDAWLVLSGVEPATNADDAWESLGLEELTFSASQDVSSSASPDVMDPRVILSMQRDQVALAMSQARQVEQLGDRVGWLYQARGLMSCVMMTWFEACGLRPDWLQARRQRELDVALQTRRAYARHREQLEQAASLSQQLAMVRRVATSLAMLRGASIFGQLYFADQLLLMSLQVRSLEFLRRHMGSSDQALGQDVSGHLLAHDLGSLASMLRQINHRQCLVQHDRELASWALAQLAQGQTPASLAPTLEAMRGMEDRLDAWLDSPADRQDLGALTALLRAVLS